MSKDVRLSLDKYRDGHAYSRYLIVVLTETDNLIAMSFRVYSLIGTIGLSKDVRLSLDKYRDGHAYRRHLIVVLTETDNLIAMSFRV